MPSQQTMGECAPNSGNWVNPSRSSARARQTGATDYEDCSPIKHRTKPRPARRVQM